MKKESQCPIMHMSDANITGTTPRAKQGGATHSRWHSDHQCGGGAHASLLNRVRATGVTLS
jgi:hypothetical protein